MVKKVLLILFMIILTCNTIFAAWFMKDGEWYYQKKGVLKTNQWVKYYNDYYYVGEDGKILKDTYTPDGYYVDKEGKYQEVSQLKKVSNEQATNIIKSRKANANKDPIITPIGNIEPETECVGRNDINQRVEETDDAVDINKTK